MSEFSNSYFLDTNIFLRVFVEEHGSQYQECSNLFDYIKTAGLGSMFYTGSVVMAELVWTLTSYYKDSKASICETLNFIENTKGINFTDNYNLPKAIELFTAKNVKFVDALIASIPQIQSKEWTVISYDRDFDKLGVRRKEPMGVKEV